MKQKVLVVSPHPDDETLGAGGTLFRYQKEGSKIFWLNMTDMKKEYGYSHKAALNRRSQINKVLKAFSFYGFFNLELKPTGLDRYPRKVLVEKVSGVMKKISPNIVIIPFKGDPHTDHRITHDVVLSAAKVFRQPSIKKILMMEIISETDFSHAVKPFTANYFVDITNFLMKKIRIMKIYKEEIGKHPFPRSVEHIKALAVIRGVKAGCQYAEAFQVVKDIN